MGNDETAPVPNDKLRYYMDRKGLTAQSLAELIPVDAKTVER